MPLLPDRFLLIFLLFVPEWIHSLGKHHVPRVRRGLVRVQRRCKHYLPQLQCWTLLSRWLDYMHRVRGRHVLQQGLRLCLLLLRGADVSAVVWWFLVHLLSLWNVREHHWLHHMLFGALLRWTVSLSFWLRELHGRHLLSGRIEQNIMSPLQRRQLCSCCRHECLSSVSRW